MHEIALWSGHVTIARPRPDKLDEQLIRADRYMKNTESGAARHARDEVIIMPGRDDRWVRLPGHALEDAQSRLKEIGERLLKLEGDHAPLLEAFFKASSLPDPDTLIAALKCGDLQVASHKSFMLALHTNNTFDAARASFLSALEGLATALAYEETYPNAMWCALLLVHGDMAKCEMYLNFLESPECSKQLPNCLASAAQAGSKGGEQKSRNLLLLQTMLSLLLYQRRPDNGWKNPTQVAKELKAPLQQFLKENKIKTLGANNKFDIEETILRWIDDDALVKLAFQKTKHDQSA